jgi:hypothetical protein
MLIASARVGACLLAVVASSVAAKPIAFARGTTAMVERGAGTMLEAQVFYAPRYWYSLGGGSIAYSASDGSFDRRIDYVRANLLVHRWNLPAAQANVFAWGGIGIARGDGIDDGTLAWNGGFQLDYETRRVYASLRADQQAGDGFSHRTDTLQLGWAPYEHDYDRLATWLVLQGREYTGGLFPGTEWALLVRLFKGGAWVEAGLTTDGGIQAMAMFNF